MQDNEDLKELLKKNLEVSEESLRLVKKLNNALRWSRFYSIVKWIIILGITFGTYYYIEPYLRVLIDMYSSILSNADKIGNSTDTLNSGKISPDLMEKIKALLSL